jgi:two-component system invasion response regulator UvrY
MIKILIADDHAIVRAGLKQIVEDTSDLTVAGEAASGREVLELIRCAEFDVLVLDISLPGKSGLDVLKDVKSEYPALPVLVLSIYPEEQYAVRVLKAGAAGYVTKESAPAELVAAIRKVAQGGKYITASLAESLADDLEHDLSRPLHKRLSDREYTVLCLLASGKTVTAIAADLCLSPKTISTYRARILAKMNMNTTAELMHYAMQHGLID